MTWRFPLVTRSHHEEVVSGLRSQIAGLARTIYGGDVPEEFQMLLGIEIPSTGTRPEPPESPEATVSRDEQIEEDQAARNRDLRSELRSRMRTRPSSVGPRLQQIMQQTTHYAARAANPAVATLFSQAKDEALKDK